MPRVLIAATTDCATELGKTVLWRSGIERVFCPPLTDLAPVRAARPDLIVIEADALSPASDIVQRIRAAADVRRVSLVVLGHGFDHAGEAALRHAGANVVLTAPPVPVLWDFWLQELLTVPRRQEARLPVRCEVWSHTHPGRGPLQGWTVNISTRGMLLETRERLAVGTKLDLSLQLPGDDSEVRITSQVVREASVTRNAWYTGVDFVVLREECRERMRTFLESAVPV
jgi:PilZ domain